MSNRDLPQLCGEETCTACAACYSACPKQAISMVPNAKGFLYPHVDTAQCIGCKLCEKKCPTISNFKTTSTCVASATWHKDARIRRDSSSGGAFTIIAEYVLAQGGVVWGAGFAEGNKLTYQCAEQNERLEPLRKSKYLQCEVGEAFKTIKKQLSEKRIVLFCGTPCHVNGLRSYIGDDENLITADFICHGTPSPKVFSDYINDLEKNFGDRISSYTFRDKNFGVSYGVATSCILEHKGYRRLSNDNNSYVKAFLAGMTQRDSCFSCNNANQRKADFTFADAHGVKLNANDIFTGASVVIRNNERALSIWKEIMQQGAYSEIEVPILTIEKGNPNYRPKPKSRDRQKSFYASYCQNGWEATKKRMLPTSWKERIKNSIFLLLGANLIYKLKYRGK